MFFFKNYPSVISISRVRHISNHQEGMKIPIQEGRKTSNHQEGRKIFPRKEIFPSTKKG
jgi:hypothetical protein